MWRGSWVVVPAMGGCLDRLSAVEFEARQDGQGAERVGGADGVAPCRAARPASLTRQVRSGWPLALTSSSPTTKAMLRGSRGSGVVSPGVVVPCSVFPASCDALWARSATCRACCPTSGSPRRSARRGAGRLARGRHGHVRQGARRRASPRVSATFSAPHTYTRTDREGSFHTLWGGDRSEVSTG